MCYIKYICSAILHILYTSYILILCIKPIPRKEFKNKLTDRWHTQKHLKVLLKSVDLRKLYRGDNNHFFLLKRWGNGNSASEQDVTPTDMFPYIGRRYYIKKSLMYFLGTLLYPP